MSSDYTNKTGGTGSRRPFDDDEFDYRKEIEEIEKQEREDAERRKLKEQAQEKLAAERAARASEQRPESASSVKKTSRSQGSTGNGGKKSRKGLIAVIIIIIAAVAGYFGYSSWQSRNRQAEQQAVTGFKDKVAAFVSDKLDGQELGTHEQYFTDFIEECNTAAENSDLTAIADLETKFAEVEAEYEAVLAGKEKLTGVEDAFKSLAGRYTVTDDYKAVFDELRADIETAVKDVDYSGIEDFASRISGLEVNLRSSNQALVQTLRNGIAGLSIDEKYITNSESAKLDTYAEDAEALEKNDPVDYAALTALLTEWKAYAQSLSDKIASQKEEEQRIAESIAAEEEESRRIEESIAESRWIEESIAESIAAEESKAAEEAARKESEEAAKKESEEAAKKESEEAAKTPEEVLAEYPEAAAVYEKYKNTYIFSESSSRYLTEDEVKDMDSYTLMIARNEIYARKGRIFSSPDLKAYFEAQSWYSGTLSPEDITESMINQYEKANLDLILKYE
ncbi:MAG: YARHG domain-containing protein [Lachnospiraceae bacterium]|nr:YARHG domain-containing protein [Lachnospiraceae bacterium]